MFVTLLCFLVPKPLVELHVKLLRKLGRSVSSDRWEKYLAKVLLEPEPETQHICIEIL